MDVAAAALDQAGLTVPQVETLMADAGLMLHHNDRKNNYGTSPQNLHLASGIVG